MAYALIILDMFVETGSSAITKSKVFPSWDLYPNRRRKTKKRQKMIKIAI